MKRFFLCAFFSLVFLYAEDRQVFNDTIYDPFFSVTITDSTGQTYRLNGAAFYNLADEKKYFLWVRRGTPAGIVTYALELDRYESIRFTAPYGELDASYTPAEITLTDGSTFEVHVNTDGYLGGYDEYFGSFGRLYLNYNQVEKIEFNHGGRYSRCSYCGTLYFDSDLEECPYDGHELVHGLEADEEE